MVEVTSNDDVTAMQVPSARSGDGQLRVSPETSLRVSFQKLVNRLHQRAAVIARGRLAEPTKYRTDDQAAIGVRKALEVLHENGKPAVGKQIELDVRRIKGREAIAASLHEAADFDECRRSRQVADDRND